MLQVDFYNLPTATIDDCLLFSCRLINKAWSQVGNIYVHCQNQQQRQQLNQLLWQFKPDSFVPHDLLEENPNSPITLGLEELDYQAINYPLLINLSFEIPKYHQQFTRIAEFVIDDTLLKDKARANYRFYNTAQYNVQYHNLSKI